MPSWPSLLVLLIALFWSAQAAAQSEHPFIARFELIELDGSVRVEWTLLGGNTCNGMDVERSLDGTFFEVVHRIPGICGDLSAEVRYEWVDTRLEELSTLHYRIRLGSDGTSSVKQVRFDQLVETRFLAYPVPCSSELNVLLNVPLNEQVELRVYSAEGREVFVYQGFGKAHQLAVGQLAAGRYSFRAVAGYQLFQGGFVKW
jgi:hypothetical protein